MSLADQIARALVVSGKRFGFPPAEAFEDTEVAEEIRVYAASLLLDLGVPRALFEGILRVCEPEPEAADEVPARKSVVEHIAATILLNLDAMLVAHPEGLGCNDIAVHLNEDYSRVSAAIKLLAAREAVRHVPLLDRAAKIVLRPGDPMPTPRLSERQAQVFEVLCAHADSCWVVLGSHDQVAEWYGKDITSSAVRNYLQCLIRKGFISLHTAGNRARGNAYLIAEAHRPERPDGAVAPDFDPSATGPAVLTDTERRFFAHLRTLADSDGRIRTSVQTMALSYGRGFSHGRGMARALTLKRALIVVRAGAPRQAGVYALGAIDENGVVVADDFQPEATAEGPSVATVVAPAAPEANPAALTARDALLMELWLGGMSSVDIAARLGLKYPRVNQIAQALRERGFDLPRRGQERSAVSRPRSPTDSAPAPIANLPAVVEYHPPSAPKAISTAVTPKGPRDLAMPAEAFACDGPKILVELHPLGCKWPLSDAARGHADQTLFCAKRRGEGVPYCPGHGRPGAVVEKEITEASRDFLAAMATAKDAAAYRPGEKVP